jgi:hypothetical protein
MLFLTTCTSSNGDFRKKDLHLLSEGFPSALIPLILVLRAAALTFASDMILLRYINDYIVLLLSVFL